MANANENDDMLREMNIVHSTVNVALVDAVKESNVNLVRKLLDQGAQPNYLIFIKDGPLSKTFDERHVEIVKLLLQHNLFPLSDLIAKIIKSKSAKELITVIIKSSKYYFWVLFEGLVINGDFNSNSAVDILEHLLALGMPLDDFTMYDLYGFFEDRNERIKLTPLHLSILHKRISFASFFLKRGADIHKKAVDGTNAFSLAIMSLNMDIIKLVLEYKPLINERSFVGLTPLHMASTIDHPSSHEIIRLLLQRGADINIRNKKGGSCLAFSCSQNKEILVAELARIKFEKQRICKENLDCLSVIGGLDRIFQDCLEELQRIKKRKIGNFYPLYDVYRFRNNSNKLISLLKNKDFISVYKLARKRETIKYYVRDIDSIFENALKKSEILQDEEKKLSSIFKDHLPQSILNRVAYFINENLCFE